MVADANPEIDHSHVPGVTVPVHEDEPRPAGNLPEQLPIESSTNPVGSGEGRKSQGSFGGAAYLDLGIIVLWLIGVILCVSQPALNATLLRIVFTLPLLLFIPGYTLLAVFFPSSTRIDIAERFIFSIGISIATIFLITFSLNHIPAGIRFGPLFTVLIVSVILLLPVAYIRRAGLSPEKRFIIPFLPWFKKTREDLLLSKGIRAERILGLAFLILLLVACVTTGYIITFPKKGESFTEFYILGRNGTLSGYAANLSARSPLFIGIGNHEHENVTYTIEIFLSQFTYNKTLNVESMVRMERVMSFQTTIQENSSAQIPYELPALGNNYNRVEFLLFKGSIPGGNISGTDRISASYRHLFLWVTNQS